MRKSKITKEANWKQIDSTYLIFRAERVCCIKLDCSPQIKSIREDLSIWEISSGVREISSFADYKWISTRQFSRSWHQVTCWVILPGSYMRPLWSGGFTFPLVTLTKTLPHCQISCQMCGRFNQFLTAHDLLRQSSRSQHQATYWL